MHETLCRLLHKPRNTLESSLRLDNTVRSGSVLTLLGGGSSLLFLWVTLRSERSRLYTMTSATQVITPVFQARGLRAELRDQFPPTCLRSTGKQNEGHTGLVLGHSVVNSLLCFYLAGFSLKNTVTLLREGQRVYHSMARNQELFNTSHNLS